MHALNILLVSSVQTSSSSSSTLFSGSTTKASEITSHVSLGASTNPPSLLTSSHTTVGEVEATTKMEYNVEMTTENSKTSIQDTSQAATTESPSTVVEMLFEGTSEPPMRVTSQTEAREVPSTEVIETTRLDATSRATLVETSQPFSTETYSTQSEKKPMLETTSESPLDNTSHPGTREESSTNALDGAILETTSQGAEVETYEPVSTERYSTDSEGNPMFQEISKHPVDESTISTESLFTVFEKERTSESIITESSKSVITEGSPTKTGKIPTGEATKGPVELYTSEAGKNKSCHVLDVFRNLHFLSFKHSLKGSSLSFWIVGTISLWCIVKLKYFYLEIQIL